MRTIHWYPLYDGYIPISAKVLHCGLRDGMPTIWCEVDPEDTERQPVFMFSTGAILPEEEQLHHIGTITGIAGDLVYHFYIKL